MFTRNSRDPALLALLGSNLNYNHVWATISLSSITKLSQNGTRKVVKLAAVPQFAVAKLRALPKRLTPRAAK